MTGKERREQLLDVGRKLFAEKGFEATTVEEIAAKAGVSKPVVYEHFGGKEGLYAVVVDREMRALLDGITGALRPGARPRAARAGGDGAARLHRELHRRLPHPRPRLPHRARRPASFASLISDVASQVEHLLAAEFKRQKLDPKTAPMYAQMLVGMVALTGQWWLDVAQAQEGRRGGPPGQPRLERPGRPRGQARRCARPAPDRPAAAASTAARSAVSAAASSSSRLPTGSSGRSGATPAGCRPSAPAHRRRRPARRRRRGPRPPDRDAPCGPARTAPRRRSGSQHEHRDEPHAAARREGRAASALGHAEDAAVERPHPVLGAGRAGQLDVVGARS